MTLDLGLAARVVAGIRAATPGATEWDTAGVAAALREVGGTPGAALAAAALAAEDRALSKPSAAALRNHWPKNTGVEQPRVSHNVRCAEHPLNVMPCPQCASKRSLPDPDEHADYIEAKAALRNVRPSSAPTKPQQLTDAEHAAIARKRLDKETNQ
jgi:hypothetical protein